MLDQNFWYKYFKVYDVLNYVIPYLDLLEEILAEADIRENELILDAGVGTGNLALLLKKKGAMVVGLDFCEEALNIYKDKDPNAKIVLTDLTKKLPFPDNYFDKIVSNNTLYNIPRELRIKTLLELKRILKPGGKIVLSNLHKDFKPIKIYLLTIKQNIKKFGIFNTIKLIGKMFIPTIKMFYYNFLIQKEHKFFKNNLFDYEEQKEILKKAGFNKISDTKFVYARQAILNSAWKL